MSKKKRVRWVCPLCCKGANGSIRPRRNDAVRYCLPCTKKTGKLTERAAPSLERKKREREEARKVKTYLKLLTSKGR
jgi:hypothetical protein